MSEQKTFFESLSPKSALIIGVVAGLLVIGTIGFFIMLGVYFGGKGKSDQPAKTDNAATAQVDDNRGQVKETVQAPKSDKPVVELFVMSHCPYGLQMEKAMLPAWSLLKNQADISVKFVNYSMHGEKEVKEEMSQLCIMDQGQNKIIDYLNCFTVADDSAKCLATAKVDTKALATCQTKLESKYGILKAFADQSTWLSGRYPTFSVFDDLNKKYGVQGSPTLVINGAQISAGRSPEEVKKAICGAFNTAPKECDTVLSTASASAGFGASTGDSQGTTAAGCGA